MNIRKYILENFALFYETNSQEYILRKNILRKIKKYGEDFHRKFFPFFHDPIINFIEIQKKYLQKELLKN